MFHFWVVFDPQIYKKTVLAFFSVARLNSTLTKSVNGHKLIIVCGYSSVGRAADSKSAGPGFKS